LNAGCKGVHLVYQCAKRWRRCVPTALDGLRDAPILFHDGTYSAETYAPWTTDPEDTRAPIGFLQRLPACNICCDRLSDVVIDAMRNGIGDVALACWYPEVTFYARGAHANVARMFGARVIDERPAHARIVSGLLAAEYAAGQPRLQYRAHQLGVETIRRPPYTISDDDHDWAVHRLAGDGHRHIYLATDTTHGVRSWSTDHWRQLALRLCADGYTVFTPRQRDQTITQAAALACLCDLLITNDSGMAHIAANCRIPALVLLGPTTPDVFAHSPEIRTISSTHPCTGCRFQPPFTKRCDRRCDSLAALTVDQVYTRAAEILSTVKRYGRKHDAIDEALRLFRGGTIVEVGSTRGPKIDAEGNATVAWARHSRDVYSVDIDPAATLYTQSLCPNVHAITADAIEWLSTWSRPIDLLYLDALDGWHADSQEWHLRAYLAARANCASLILIDDQETKGGLVIDQAQRDGWRLVHRQYQALLALR
jgi:hypothetical protein